LLKTFGAVLPLSGASLVFDSFIQVVEKKFAEVYLTELGSKVNITIFYFEITKAIVSLQVCLIVNKMGPTQLG
jgi:hypothetical protein